MTMTDTVEQEQQHLLTLYVSVAVPKLPDGKQVWLVKLLKGADKVPRRVVDPIPLVVVTKLEAFTAAHCPVPVQVQLGDLRVAPDVMLEAGGSPTITQGFKVALP